MIEILRRVHKETLKDVDLETDDISDEETIEESEELLDSDDEENVNKIIIYIKCFPSSSFYVFS